MRGVAGDVEANGVLMGQKVVGQKDPITWTCAPLLGAWLVGAVLIGVLVLLNWPRG